MSAWENLITVQSNVDYDIVVIACRNFAIMIGKKVYGFLWNYLSDSATLGLLSFSFALLALQIRVTSRLIVESFDNKTLSGSEMRKLVSLDRIQIYGSLFHGGIKVW
jgi:hypothetical protein